MDFFKRSADAIRDQALESMRMNAAKELLDLFEKYKVGDKKKDIVIRKTVGGSIFTE